MSEANTRSIERPIVDRRRARRARLAALVRARQLSPARWFLLVSLLILVAGMFSAGWWLGDQIETQVIRRTLRTNSVYIESFVAPLLNDRDIDQAIEPSEAQALKRILGNTPLGREIVAFIIWGPNGHVLYSSYPDEIGRRFPVDEDLSGAFAGEITWELTAAHSEDHIPPQNRSDQLLAIYTPVRLEGSSQVAAVVEFYQEADQLQADISQAQRRTWLIVAVVTIVMYLLLAGFIRRTSNTIVSQQSALSTQVAMLTDLLAQNKELHNRVGRAARRAATLNERFLRRTSAELHDGPAQYISASLLHLDRVAAYHEATDVREDVAEHLEIAQASLAQAMSEVRAISSGLGLPQIDQLSLPDTIRRVVRAHQRRTNAEPRVVLGDLPAQASMAIKVTAYRVIQEGLTNAARHAAGAPLQVRAWLEDPGMLWIELADQGPGFRPPAADDWGEHMGLAGMRERVESLGGMFTIQSEPGGGTCIRACLPLHEIANDAE
jgi:signal transduction histidine kinase